MALIATLCGPVTSIHAEQGDLNCDGAVSTTDIPIFVDALLGIGGLGSCDVNRADMNADGQINGRDTQQFVHRLFLYPCSGGATWCNGVCTNTAFDPLNCGSCGIVCPQCCFGGVCQECN